MDYSIKDINIGEIIDNEIHRQRLPYKEVATRLKMDISNFKKTYMKKDISTSWVRKISEVLNHNFFMDFCDYQEQLCKAIEQAGQSEATENATSTDKYKILYEERLEELHRLQEKCEEMAARNAVLEYQLSQEKRKAAGL